MKEDMKKILLLIIALVLVVSPTIKYVLQQERMAEMKLELNEYRAEDLLRKRDRLELIGVIEEYKYQLELAREGQ